LHPIFEIRHRITVFTVLHLFTVFTDMLTPIYSIYKFKPSCHLLQKPN